MEGDGLTRPDQRPDDLHDQARSTRTMQDHKIRRGANKEENRIMLNELRKKSLNGFVA
jgi:hypothetical protein